MAKINLIPEVRQEKLKLSKLNSGVTTAVVIVAIVFVGAIIILSAFAGVLVAEKTNINNQIDGVNSKLTTMKELESTVVNLEGGLADIKNIVSGKKDWNDFLSVLEKTTPGDIQFTSLSVVTDTVTASVTGKDVSSIDRFIQSFSTAKNDKGENYFQNVSVKGYTLKDTGQSNFTATFNINEAAIW